MLQVSGGYNVSIKMSGHMFGIKPCTSPSHYILILRFPNKVRER
jgi:hypothetical protein